MKRKIELVRFAVLLVILAFSHVLSAQISGTVFRDFNANGTQDAGEIGEPGISVRIYNTSGEVAGSPVTTNGSGAYSLPAATGMLRVEFNLPSWYFASNGNLSNTSVQFVNAGGTANLGINAPNDYFSVTNPNPPLIFSRHLNGNPLGGGDAGTGGVLASVPYNIGCGIAMSAGGSAPNATDLATGVQIGSTWGLAFQRESRKLFLASVLRRHMGLGPGKDGNGQYASGAIYLRDMPSGTPTYFFSLDELGFPTQAAGAYSNSPFGTSLVIGSNTDRQLGSTTTSPNVDPAAWHQVGRVSLGDIDLSDDGKHMYIMNLYDKKLYRVFINNPAVAPTASDVASFSVPDPGCTSSSYYPWAVKVHRGKVYVGVVCPAEQDVPALGTGAAALATRAKLYAHVYEFDIATSTFNMTPVLSVQLDYKKGCAYGATCTDGEESRWGNWDDMAANNDREYSSPILSDIEFDIDGDIVIGLMDRNGMKKGYRNSEPDEPIGSPNTSESKYYSGDILRADYNYLTGTFTMENNGTVGATTTSGAGNGEGIGGGEYYFAEVKGNTNCTTDPDSHREIFAGGLALMAGKGEVVMTAFDPASSHGSGILILSNSTGDTGVSRYQIDKQDSGTVAYFGKAGGVGDIELQGDPAPIEIGNRIWADTDLDGVQDPDEAGIPGVTVMLLNAADAMVSSAVTDAAGRYYFSNGTGTDQDWAKYGLTGLTYNTAGYKIKVATAQFALTATPSLSPKDAASGTGSDLRDSDADLIVADAVIVFNTAAAGENNHTYDIGFHAAAACTVTINSATPSACVPATNTYSLTVNVSWTNASGTTLTVSVPGGSATLAVTAGSSGTNQTVTITGLAANGTQDIDVTAQFDATCTTTATDAYDAPAGCTPPCAIPTLWAIDEDSGHLYSVTDWTTTSQVNATSYDWGLIRWSSNNCVTQVNVNASGGSELESAAWDSATNEYYLTSNKDLGAFNAPVLLKIDLDDLMVGQQPCAKVVGAISAGGQDIESLAIDPTNGDLYGGSKANGMLYKFNKATAAILPGYPVQMTKPSPLSGNLNDSESLTFDSAGNLYVSETDDEDVYIINKTTGAGISVYDNNTAPLGLDGITWDFAANRLIGFEDNSATMQSILYEITPGNGGNITLSNTYAAGLVDIEGLELACPVAACVTPTHNAPTTAAGTCTGGTPNNNATITVTGIANADRIGISTGATYSGTPAYAAATNIAGAMHTFTGLMHNTQYTIRLFNGADNCFTDVTVTTASITCVLPPMLTHDKTGPVIGTQQPNGSYNVTYTITVTNSGGGAGTYSLYDTPTFDDDIAINGTPSFTTNAPGHPANPGPVNLSSINGTSNTLATGQAIAANATHTYTLTYNVTLNLEPGSGGNNVYTACGSVAPGTPVAGQGLFNQSRLDAGNDGTIDETDQVCGDLPYLVLVKTADNVTDNGSGNYTVTYTLTVSNLGGAAANYTLTDTPGFDDDATITGASYTALLPPAAVTAPITLSPIPPAPSWGIGAANQAIAAGAVHTYTLTVTANVDLSAGSTGDNYFRDCITTTTTTSMPGDAFFNSAQLQGMGTTTITRVRDVCTGPMTPPSGYSIGSTVFRDLNNNGLQDPTETGIAGVTMQLWEVVGVKDPTPGSPAGADGADILVPVGSDGTLATPDDAMPYVSDAAGNYFFTGLSARSYYVVIPGTAFGAGGALQMLPTSSSPAVTDTDDNREDGDDNGIQMGGSGTMVMSPVIALGPGTVEPTGAQESYQGGTQDDGPLDGQGDMTVDFGFFAPVSLGDTTWVDLNGNGRQDALEPPLPGVKVTLFNAATNTMVTTDANGNTITGMTTTNSMGFYEFTNLSPGNYYVVFDISMVANPEYYALTTANQGPDTDDSDADPVTGQTAPTGFLPSGTRYPDLDAGVVCQVSANITVMQVSTCSTRSIELSTLGASITPSTLNGVWSTSGTGVFLDAGLLGVNNNFLQAGGGAGFYLPSPADIAAGSVTLTLTTNTPPAGVACPAASDTVQVIILKVDCGNFPWDGN